MRGESARAVIMMSEIMDAGDWVVCVSALAQTTGTCKDTLARLP